MQKGSIRRDNPCGCPFINTTILGKLAENQVKLTEKRYNIEIDKYVIMPNHIHLMININNNNLEGHLQGASLQQIIGAYKSYISSSYLKICKEQDIFMGQIWQRGYYEHIIRTYEEYKQIWEYIDINPLKWELDKYYVGE